MLNLGALKVAFTKRAAVFTPLATKLKSLTVLKQKLVIFLNLILAGLPCSWVVR